MRKKWGIQKDGLIRDFGRLIQKHNKRKKAVQRKVDIFFDASKFLVFADATGLNNSSDSVPSDDNIQVLPSDTIEQNYVDSNVQSNSDNDSSQIPNEPIPSTSSDIFANFKFQSKKRSHGDNSHLVCIICLEKTKERWPKKLCNNESACNSIAALYPDFYQDQKFLPEIICQCCFDKLKIQSQCTVDYKALVLSVKESLCFNSESPTSTVCEICKLGSTSINFKKSSFLLQSKPKPGSVSTTPVTKTLPKITSFYPFARSKKLNEQEKIEKMLDSVDTDNMDQVCATHLDRQFRKNGKASLKRLHGPKQIIQKVVKRIPSKAVISHSTLLKIKKELNSSGNKVIKLAKILKDDCDVKIEEYFKEHVIGTGKDVESFFECKNEEMEIYNLVDFQYWRLSEGKMVSKDGEMHHEDKIVILPDVGKPGVIEDVHSGQVLTLKSDDEVIFSNKIKVTVKTTRSSLKILKLRASKNDTSIPTTPEFSDTQSWIAGPANSEGWFRITHTKSGKYLTSNGSESMTCEDLIDPNDNPKRKVLLKVKKDIGFCHTEAFITHVVEKRGYADDSELKIEMGIDGGKGKEFL